jgi:hypothetical protein
VQAVDSDVWKTQVNRSLDVELVKFFTAPRIENDSARLAAHTNEIAFGDPPARARTGCFGRHTQKALHVDRRIVRCRLGLRTGGARRQAHGNDESLHKGFHGGSGLLRLGSRSTQSGERR